MIDSPEKDYQILCPGDKRNITEKLKKFLTQLYDVYGPNYHDNIPVGKIILSNKEIIRDFVELMRSEEKTYIGSVSVKDDIYSDRLQSQIDKKQNSDQSSSLNKKNVIVLSDEVKAYIDSMIQDIVSKKIDEKIKPFLECLAQYEEEIQIYRERETKHQEEENKDIYSDINVRMMSSHRDDGVSTSEIRENYGQKELVQAGVLNGKGIVGKSENVGLMNSLTDKIQEKIREALNIYNEHNASENYVVRKILKKTFDKPSIRLVLPNEDAKDFANKPIKDLKNDKTYQTVFLESTDGSSDYFAIPVSENIYVVFPVKFESYNQNFAWKRAYPLFFEILPNDEAEAHSYILKQPAFFKKKDGRYQMLENGKGCIELVP